MEKGYTVEKNPKEYFMTTEYLTLMPWSKASKYIMEEERGTGRIMWQEGYAVSAASG